MVDKIVEVKRVGTEDEANALLREGWELHSVVSKGAHETLGVHWILVRRTED